MKNHIKLLSLYVFIISAIMLFSTTPTELYDWIKEHSNLVSCVYIFSWTAFNLVASRDD